MPENADIAATLRAADARWHQVQSRRICAVRGGMTLAEGRAAKDAAGPDLGDYWDYLARQVAKRIPPVSTEEADRA